ncbi:MAG TPA: LysR substrate-binding domain-containing protein [Microbacteriaceae bacterium]|jgi:hypothetical protein|nr:LysR substrate-binding domain-containing protein [Microbacteriaceae bacterium]HQX35464.1 LysR substrate-binding domain-containing protein [Microbacteriaceae bacterium]HQZ47185.1 LysR substrate-binding domain-containing protein [Microbacteriaceae bacterium]HRA08262.1 LysR substrate-binding domain-containing protein [Microbacteriaceae bacterium]
MAQEKRKGKGKAKRRDPRKGPASSSGKRPGKGTKKVAPKVAPAAPTALSPADASTAGATNEQVRAGGTAKAPFSAGRAPRAPRPAAVKARALKAERAAAADAARASADAPLAVAHRPRGHAQAPASGIEDELAGAERAPETLPPREPLSTLTLGYIAGATPGRWADTWSTRNPERRLILRPLTAAEQRPALDDDVDLALVRLPLAGVTGADAGVHVIPLYEEVAFVVVSIESELSLLEEARFEDLAGQVLIVPGDDVLGELSIAGLVPPEFEPIATTEEAIATVAAGVGIVVVPQSLARLHRRKDVVSMPLLGGPTSAVALAWKAERESDDLTSFVGVVRGRKATSSR